jgi:GxxExxY protein
MIENKLSELAIGCAMKVHTALGPGLLESAYEECLYYELCKSNLFVEKQKPMPLIYEDVKLDCGYRIDIMIENKLVLEIKAVEKFNEIHLAQILTYLKLSKCQLGLLLNFNTLHLKNGIKRVINTSIEKTNETHYQKHI